MVIKYNFNITDRNIKFDGPGVVIVGNYAGFITPMIL